MKLTILATAVAAISPAWAQTSGNPALPQVVITANPLGRGDVATPATVLAGDGLLLRRAATLGETLDGLPGVAATHFGPNANRPIIRGQDGDRIRVLSNAGAALDASSLSFDHAVPIDPLVVERIEVLRGPAALLYGGSAVGGVVNTIDNRIPKNRIDTLGGAVETRLGGAAHERAASALLETGAGPWAFHADAFGRRTDDLQVPGFNRPLDDGSSERRTRVRNSASRAQGGAAGASWVNDQGHVGASVDSYRNTYGIVAEDDITIRMQRDKLALAGETRALNGALGRVFESVAAQAGSTRYQHQEVEGDGSIGTTFKTRGQDARLQANHRAVALGAGRLEGTWGLQWESSRFSALGEEAFVPSTHTRQAAVFALERWSWGAAGHLSAGLRAERVQVQSDGDSDPTVVQFGAAHMQRYAPRSASVAGVFNLNSRWRLSTSLAHTERAPTHYELHANGVHAATAVFEQGDPAQRLERGRNVDVGLAWHSGPHQVKVSVFDSRFSNYIVLAASGNEHTNDEGEAFPIFNFRGVRARLYGFEAEAHWRVLPGATHADLSARLDAVRGVDQSTGEALPRLPPLRATLALDVGRSPWLARVEVQHARAQNRVPSTDGATDGFTLLNLSAHYKLPLAQRGAVLFVKLMNAGNTLANSATATSTIRPLAPLPGRALTAGLRFMF